MNLERLELTEEVCDGDYRIFAKGDLIITNAKELQSKLDQAVLDDMVYIILDLTGVKYIDSFGIGVVVKTKAGVDKKKGRLRVIVNPTILNLFEKCHLDDYIQLELQEEEEENENETTADS